MTQCMLYQLQPCNVCPHNRLTYPSNPCLLQVVLLPVLAGAALNSAFPKQVAAVAPLCSLAAVAGISLICGSVVAQNAAAIAAAAPKLLAAVFALHAGALGRHS